MLAYAASRQRVAERRSSPSTMLMIIGGHVAVVALAMSAKFIVEHGRADPPIIIENIPLPQDPPPPPPPKPDERTQVRAKSEVFVPKPVETIPLPGPIDLDTTTRPTQPTGPTVGDEPPGPVAPILPLRADPVRLGPRLATPPSALRPPYPTSKLDNQEEAALRLRLSIDERGRVVAVDPVGTADAAFLNAARKHLIARWKYKPATVDGKPVASSTVITLRFELDG